MTRRAINSIKQASTMIFGLLCVVAAPNAHSASLERLGDGRVVIKALGERLAFREKDASRVMWYWPSEPCGPKRRSSLTVALWLEDPEVAECLKLAIPDDFVPDRRQTIGFKIYFGYENGGRYPGLGKRIDQPLGNVPPLYPGGIKPEELPEPPFLDREFLISIRSSYTGLECLSPIKGPQDALGYEPHGGVNLHRQENTHCLPIAGSVMRAGAYALAVHRSRPGAVPLA